MLLLVGLGNPGKDYAGNRHNIGFMAVEAIADRHRFAPWRKRFQGLTADGAIGEIKAIALKPETYMNESGRAVAEAAKFFKLTPADIVVFHDDLDLAPGKVRVKTGGGHAGHNGLRSITAHLGADFRRVRLGIGHPGHKDLVTRHVLGDFAKADQAWLAPLRDAIADAAPFLAAGDDARFQTEVARLTQSEARAEPEAKAEKPSTQAEAARKALEARANAKPSPRAPGTRGGETAMAAKLRAFLKRDDDGSA